MPEYPADLGNVDPSAPYAPVADYARVFRGKPVPRKQPTSTMVFFGATGHGWTTAAGTATLNDTTVTGLGTQSLTITSSGAQVQKTAMGPFNVNNSKIRIIWRYSGTGTPTQLTCYLASDNSLANRKSKNFLLSTSATALPPDTDLVIDVPYADFGGASGTLDPTNVVMMRLLSGWTGSLTMSIEAIYLIPDDTVALPSGAVVFSFDDANIDHWNLARPYLAKYGYTATLYPQVSLIGSGAASYTLAQLQFMQDVHGFEVGCHAYDTAHHIDHIAQTEAWLRAHFESLQAYNKTNYLRGDTFAWPNTTNDAFARTVAADYFTASRGSITAVEVHPSNSPQNLRAINCGPLTLAAVKAFVDVAKAGHAVAHLFFHGLPVTKVATNDFALADFQSVVDYVNAQGLAVLTTSQAAALSVA